MNQERKQGGGPLGETKSSQSEEVVMAELVLSEDSLPEAGDARAASTSAQAAASEHSAIAAVELNLVERMLSPESLQRMMMVGGGLLAIGFAIWLWSIGVFDEGWVLATAVGAGNIACLIGGAWLLRKTKLTTAGLGLVMLSCLVMPLNLWLYHSQELIVLGSGGQLWIPALLISIIYAGVARLTRNSMFVYTLVAGIVMTGMLFLAGVPTNLFWAALPTSTFLIAVGAIAIQADRWFGEKEGAFTRNQFGIASYRSGIITLVAGLGVLLGGQLLAFAPSFLVQESAKNALMFLTVTKGKLWTLALLGGAGYSCVHAMMYDRNSWYIKTITAMIGVWSVNQVLYLLDVRLTMDLVVLIVGSLIVGLHAWSLYVQNTIGALASKGNVGDVQSKTADAGPAGTQKSAGSSFALTILGMACLLALFGVSAWRSLYQLDQIGTLFVNWQHAFSIVLVAGGAILSPLVWRKGDDRGSGIENWILSFAGVVVALAFAIIVDKFSGLTAANELLIVAAAAVLAAVGVFAWPKSENGKRLGSLASGVCWGGALIGVAFTLIGGIVFWATVSGILFAILLAAAWLMISKKNSGRLESIAGGIAAILAVAQLKVMLGMSGPYSAILTCSVIGWVGVIVFGMLSVKASKSSTPLSESWLPQIFRSMVLIGATASVLFTAFSLDRSGGQWSQVALLIAQSVGLAVSALFVGNGNWRKSYFACIPIVLLTGLIVLVVAASLTMSQQIEICCLFAGVLVTVGAYVGWATERDEPNDATTVSFWIGTTLLVLPMLIGLLLGRIDGGEVIYSWRGVHEIGGLLIGLALLGSGILCRIRATTLGGGIVLATLVLSNLLMINWPGELQDASVLMMIGGGSFFAVAVLLSVYRDRILQLPERVREGKGVFSVMKWR